MYKFCEIYDLQTRLSSKFIHVHISLVKLTMKERVVSSMVSFHDNGMLFNLEQKVTLIRRISKEDRNDR